MTSSKLLVVVTGTAVFAAGFLIVACKREAARTVAVSRPAAATGPSTQEAADDEAAKLLASLEPLEELGIGVSKKMPDGEMWMVYPNGLAMQIIKPGYGTIPRLAQKVTVNYVGTIPETKKVFDQTEKDKPFEFQLGMKGIIKGWNLAIPKLAVGSKARVWIPGRLAYGVDGKIPNIGPNQDLIFDIEVVKVSGDSLEIPETQMTDAERARRMETLEPIPELGASEPKKMKDGETYDVYPNGLGIKMISEGKGPVPRLGETLTVNYKGTIPENKGIFDAGREFEFELGTKGIIKGWNLAFSKFPKGTKAKIYVPSVLGYGAAGSPPKIPANQDLVFDVELTIISGKAVDPPATQKSKEPDLTAPAGPATKTAN